MNIYEKMMMITEEIGVIEKNLNVQISTNKVYKAVSERDVLDAVKPIENKYRVYSYPFDRKVILSDTLVKESEYNGTITKTNTLFMRLEITYRFVNIDKPEEFIDVKSYGDGLDTGDKAPGKAMTYGDKYALMKAYKLSTGDDPDKDASPEKGFSKKQEVEKVLAVPCTEGQKQRIREFDEDLTKKYLMENNASKISDLTYGQAMDFINSMENKE